MANDFNVSQKKNPLETESENDIDKNSENSNIIVGSP